MGKQRFASGSDVERVREVLLDESLLTADIVRHIITGDMLGWTPRCAESLSTAVVRWITDNDALAMRSLAVFPKMKTFRKYAKRLRRSDVVWLAALGGRYSRLRCFSFNVVAYWLHCNDASVVASDDGFVSEVAVVHPARFLQSAYARRCGRWSRRIVRG